MIEKEPVRFLFIQDVGRRQKFGSIIFVVGKSPMDIMEPIFV